MQRNIITLLICILATASYAQKLRTHRIKPDSNTYANILVKKIAEDSNQSIFIIWVKKEVKMHYHQHHTEYVQILNGKGIMTLNDSIFKIKKGDAIRIPQGAKQAVVTTSRKPLKVLSLQAPKWDGDRIWVEEI
jgi:mannose-6-phosphate isomerase-like protein (cupin superfamily)